MLLIGFQRKKTTKSRRDFNLGPLGLKFIALPRLRNLVTAVAHETYSVELYRPLLRLTILIHSGDHQGIQALQPPILLSPRKSSKSFSPDGQTAVNFCQLVWLFTASSNDLATYT